MKAYLWEKSKIPEFPAIRKDLATYVKEGKLSQECVQFPMPFAVSPENIMIVVAGGDQAGHGYWMQVGYGGKPLTAKIELPPNWEELLEKAERDLGPLPYAR